MQGSAGLNLAYNNPNLRGMAGMTQWRGQSSQEWPFRMPGQQGFPAPAEPAIRVSATDESAAGAAPDESAAAGVSAANGAADGAATFSHAAADGAADAGRDSPPAMRPYSGDEGTRECGF